MDRESKEKHLSTVSLFRVHAVPKVMRLLKGIVTVKNITVMDFKII